MKRNLTVLGTNELINHDELHEAMYKTLKWSTKLKREINPNFLKSNIQNQELIYHPLWLAKLLVIADRKPFRPKEIPMMAFVDSISGYRGLLSTIPEMADDITIPPSKTIEPIIMQPEEVKKYIRDVQKSQINRSYALKKPKHKIVDYFLVHLPIWKVNVVNKAFKHEFFINANTGEAEDHMASLWNPGKWMRIKE